MKSISPKINPCFPWFSIFYRACLVRICFVLQHSDSTRVAVRVGLVLHFSERGKLKNGKRRKREFVKIFALSAGDEPLLHYSWSHWNHEITTWKSGFPKNTYKVRRDLPDFGAKGEVDFSLLFKLRGKTCCHIVMEIVYYLEENPNFDNNYTRFTPTPPNGLGFTSYKEIQPFFNTTFYAY